MAKIKIKRLHMVASWTWNGPEELCGICHTELDGCAPEAQFPGDDSPVVWGQCTHAFHLSCIDEWCQKQNDAPTCPMCRRPWEIAADNNESNKGGAAQHDENVNNISATSEGLLMTPLPQTQGSIQPPSSVATPTPLQVNDSDDEEDDELLLRAEHVTTPTTSISGISLAPRYHHHDHHHLNSAQHDEEFDELIISRIDPVSEFYRSDSRVNFSLDDDDVHHTC